ncbi:LacI family DNA-binding transcriptional regulator [Cohnella fermenti]|uniref:LacI family transcriptional regulator n=1 Tax=Cohnella fermenti TaxID=2565925 RepID=A0A4S4BG75_9BACL|nr:LacI family DNA-binding transcriptional regulator [Cohnella fermenti]THF73403.1 LacI family transcriptional regulator [Cohnella fermenti]
MSKATIKQVAREAGISTATVSRVLNDSGYVSDEIKKRVLEAVAKLNYRPSAVARSLKQDKTYMIGIIVPDISNPYFMGISRGIEDVVGPEGFQLLFCSSEENPAKESKQLRLLLEKRVDAIVLATSGGNESVVRGVWEAGVPIVLIDRKLELDNGVRLDLVAEDNVDGAYQLTRKLLQDGYRRIGVVNGPIRVSTGKERYEGVLKAMREFALPWEPLVFNGEFTAEGGSRAVAEFLASDHPPAAIVSLNNRMSLGVLLEIVRHGLRIPDDLAVASFGEVEAGSLLKRPALYYTEQNPNAMGRKTGEILLARIRRELPSAEAAIEIYPGEVKQIQ